MFLLLLIFLYYPLRTTANVKQIIFIRHADSSWNENKQEMKKVGRFKKISKLAAHYVKGTFVDAELTATGIERVRSLTDWVGKVAGAQCVVNDLSDIFKKFPKIQDKRGDTSAVASCDGGKLRPLLTDETIPWATSNLKRAFMTGLIMLRNQFTKARCSMMYVLSALQELGRNRDTTSSTPKGKVPSLTEADWTNIHGTENSPQCLQYDVTKNEGTYYAKSANKRFDEFCEWTKTLATNIHTVVVAGHSSWLAAFYKKGLHAMEHRTLEQYMARQPKKDKQIINLAETLLANVGDVKGVKLHNASVIVFALDMEACSFVPRTTQLIYGEWSVKKLNKPFPLSADPSQPHEHRVTRTTTSRRAPRRNTPKRTIEFKEATPQETTKSCSIGMAIHRFWIFTVSLIIIGYMW